MAGKAETCVGASSGSVDSFFFSNHDPRRYSWATMGGVDFFYIGIYR